MVHICEPMFQENGELFICLKAPTWGINIHNSSLEFLEKFGMNSKPLNGLPELLPLSCWESFTKQLAAWLLVSQMICDLYIIRYRLKWFEKKLLNCMFLEGRLVYCSYWAIHAAYCRNCNEISPYLIPEPVQICWILEKGWRKLDCNSRLLVDRMRIGRRKGAR